MIDFTPLVWPVFGFLGAILGTFVALFAWIFIPAGAWMLAVVAGFALVAFIGSMVLV